MDLTDLRIIKALLKKHGIWSKKSLGQHFLVSRQALNAVVDAGDLTKDDTVIEIGPGCGVLTVELAARAKTVHAVELDAEIIPVLEEVTASLANVVIHNQDIRTFSPPEGPYKVIANIPYYITGKILRFFLEEIRNRPTLLVLMTQKEVAHKITALPPDANILSVAVQTLGIPHIVAAVPSKAFYPAPDVDSAVIAIQTKEPPRGLDLKQYFRIVRAAFGQSRKQIHNGLSANLVLPPEMVKEWLNHCSIDPTRRPETLTVAEWSCLAQTVPTL